MTICSATIHKILNAHFTTEFKGCETRNLPTSSTWFILRTLNQLVKINTDKQEARLELLSLGHQVNTLFCLIAAKRKKGRRKREEREREQEECRKKETTDFGRAVATSLCIKSKDKVIRQH